MEQEDETQTPMRDSCPICGEPFDEIDYEYQLCYSCSRHLNQDTDDDDDYPEGWPYDEQDDPDQQSEDNNPNDSRNL